MRLGDLTQLRGRENWADLQAAGVRGVRRVGNGGGAVLPRHHGDPGEEEEQRAVSLDSNGISEALAAADRRDDRKGASLLRDHSCCPRGLGGRV